MCCPIAQVPPGMPLTQWFPGTDLAFGRSLMSWVDDIERLIVTDYVQLAQCFPASDRGLERYRRLWLESVADELAPVLADPVRTPVPFPFDLLIPAFLTEEGLLLADTSDPVDLTAQYRRGIEAFMGRVATL